MYANVEFDMILDNWNSSQKYSLSICVRNLHSPVIGDLLLGRLDHVELLLEVALPGEKRCHQHSFNNQVCHLLKKVSRQLFQNTPKV